MAGLPQDRPIPGAPLLDPLGVPAELAAPVPIAPAVPGAPLVPQLPDVDPLTGLPAAPPPPEPQGYQFDAQGEPLPWPPDSLFDGMAGYQGRDVPVVENEPPPPPEVDAVSGAAPAVATAKPAAPAQPENPYPEPPKKPSTGDPYLDTLNDTADARARAAIAEAEATKEKNLYLADEGTRIAREQSERQAAADAEYRQVYNEAKAHRQQLDQEAQDIANQKIDPKRAWKNSSLGAQIFTIATAALTGATTRSLQTGQNPVLQAVEAMADRDMKAQAMDIENRQNMLQARRGLIADDLAAGRDMLDVQYRSLNAAYGMAENAMKAYALKFDNPVIDARLAAGLADIQERKVTLGMNYQQAKEQQLYARRQDAIHNAQANRGLDIQAYNAETSRFTATQKPSVSVRDQAIMSKEQREQQKYHDERLIPGAKTKKGEELLVLDDKQAGPLRDKMATVTSAVQGVQRLKEIRKKNGMTPFGQWGNDDMKEAKYIYENLLADWSKAKEQGVIRDAEYKRYESMFGSIGGVLDPTANLDAVEDTMVQGMNNELRAKVPKQDVAWWTPEGVAAGNDETSTTSSFMSKQKQGEERRQDQLSPRAEWEIVGQSPDGTKNLTQGGVVIPAGRQIVGQSTRTVDAGGGRTIRTQVYELDDGSTLDIEE